MRRWILPPLHYLPRRWRGNSGVGLLISKPDHRKDIRFPAECFEKYGEFAHFRMLLTREQAIGDAVDWKVF